MGKVALVVVFVVLISWVGFAQKEPIVRDAKPSEYGMSVASPVTGVEFRVRRDTKVVEYMGKVFYFDARRDLEMFLADPRKYAGPFVVRRAILANEIGKVVVSPISGKIFLVSPSVISVEYDGKVFYLLSEAEYQIFERNPDIYPVVTVDTLILTNVLVRTNYVVVPVVITNYVTNIHLVKELEIRTNYYLVTNQPTVQVLQPQVRQQEKVVVVREEPRERVVVVQEQPRREERVVVVTPQVERVTTVVIDVKEEEALIKFQRKRGKDVIIVRGPHQKELGKLAVSPISGEFVVSTTSYVVRIRKNLYYLKDEKELSAFLDNVDRYAR